MRNESARRLRTGPDPTDPEPASQPRARVFGVVVEDLSNPYASDVARGVEATLNEAGFEAFWLTTDHSPDKERRILDLLEAQRATGVVAIPVCLGAVGIDRLRAAGMSVVLLDRAGHDVCSAQVDHVAGGDIAAAHLLNSGREDLVFVTGLPAPRPCEDRRDGAARTLLKAGGGELVTLVQDALTPTEGRAAAQRLLAMDPVPNGVFCANDLIAIGLVNELVRLGVRVPEDIAVIGYDDIELATSAAVPLTTIRQPRQQLGMEAAELALAEMAEGKRHQHRQIVLVPELVIRESA